GGCQGEGDPGEGGGGGTGAGSDAGDDAAVYGGDEADRPDGGGDGGDGGIVGSRPGGAVGEDRPDRSDVQPHRQEHERDGVSGGELCVRGVVPDAAEDERGVGEELTTETRRARRREVANQPRRTVTAYSVRKMKER